jgi:hypothetical protein
MNIAPIATAGDDDHRVMSRLIRATHGRTPGRVASTSTKRNTVAVIHHLIFMNIGSLWLLLTLAAR